MSGAKPIVFPLSKALKDPGFNKEHLKTAFTSFSCEHRGTDYDCYVADVENFLRFKAVENERKGFSRTYLITNGAAIQDGSFALLGFFTLGLTVTSYEGISPSKKRNVLGSFPGRDATDYFPGLLVGQLGKNQGCPKEFLPTETLFDLLEATLERGHDSLGGNLLYLDCASEMIEYYRARGFTVMENSQRQNDLYRLFRPMPRIA